MGSERVFGAPLTPKPAETALPSRLVLFTGVLARPGSPRGTEDAQQNGISVDPIDVERRDTSIVRAPLRHAEPTHRYHGWRGAI